MKKRSTNLAAPKNPEKAVAKRPAVTNGQGVLSGPKRGGSKGVGRAPSPETPAPRLNAEQPKGKSELSVTHDGSVSIGQVHAAMIATPNGRHAFLQNVIGSRMVTLTDPAASASLAESIQVLDDIQGKYLEGDTALAVKALVAQATTWDTVATDLLLKGYRAEQFIAQETYIRLAMKAQARSQSALEAAAKIMRGGEQVVRHVHVNDGGQAVIAGTFNHGGSLPQGEGVDAILEGQSDAAAAV